MRLLTLMLLAATVASAHDAPVLPSTCAVGTIEVRAADAVAIADPSDASERLRVTYDTSRDTATFCASLDCAAPPAVRVLRGGLTGTLALPAVLVATLLDSGDLVARDVAIAVALADGTTATLAATLTTGVVASGDGVVAGEPIDDRGRFTLVGAATAPALPAPFGTPALRVRLTGQLDPAPDLDQFAAGTAALSGRITRRVLALTARFTPGSTLDPRGPVALRVAAGDATLADAVLPAGLVRRGRTFAGASADGRTRVTLRVVRRKPEPTYTLAVRTERPDLPSTGPAAVDLAYDLGGQRGRGRRTVRLRAAGGPR